MFTIGLVACNYVVKLQADDSSNDYSASSFYQVVLKLERIYYCTDWYSLTLLLFQCICACTRVLIVTLTLCIKCMTDMPICILFDW